jgi:hypothetical protein
MKERERGEEVTAQTPADRQANLMVNVAQMLSKTT